VPAAKTAAKAAPAKAAPTRAEAATPAPAKPAPAKPAPAKPATAKPPVAKGPATGSVAPVTKAIKAAATTAKAAGKQTSVKATATKQTGGKEIATKETSKVPLRPHGDSAEPVTDGALALDAAAEAKAKRARPTPLKKPEVGEVVPTATTPVSTPADDEEPRDLFLEHQRVLLVAERHNYTRQAEELKAQAEALALEHEPGDVQFDEEGGEGGTANVDRELDLHLSAQAQAAIEEIDAALDKITAGTYGFCESCGSAIPKARLEALPHARLCVSCKSGGLSARRQ
jgi:DnaK suppressor protein